MENRSAIVKSGRIQNLKDSVDNVRAVLLYDAEGERVLGQPAGDAGGGAADGCRGVAAGDGAPLPGDHLAVGTTHQWPLPTKW